MYKKPERLALIGPLDVADYNKYHKGSQEEFKNLWNLKWVEDSQQEDFTLMKGLGSGSFGVVFLIQNKKNGSTYAQKSIDKKKIVRTNQLDHTKNEMNIMKCINFPFAIYLEHFFKDNSYLHFVMPYISGGELFYYLAQRHKFREDEARFFGAQVVLSIEYLHSLDIIYRDLKPENLLIDCTGYLKLADFGFSKIVTERTYSICGTPEYMAPEIILNKGYGKAVDWWAVGVLLFELVSGRTPFYHADSIVMHEKSVYGQYTIPKYFSRELEDLIDNILQFDLTRRYGNLQHGADDIKNHIWFRAIDWMLLFNRKMQSPFIPKPKTQSFRTVSDLQTSPENLYENEFESF